MITRQGAYDALFLLKESGIDVSVPLRVLSTTPGLPESVLEFLRNNSPQHQFFTYLKQKQKAVVKNILNYETLTSTQKIKVCSSLITRAMIAIEYREISENLISELKLLSVSKAISTALEYNDYTQVDNILAYYKAIFSTRDKERGELINKNGE